MITSGDIVEIFEYERPVILGKSRNALGRAVEASEEDKRETRKKTLSQSHSYVRRLINANVKAWGESPKFVTLTFAENVQDIPTANYEFKKFRQRLEYEYKIKLKYLVVMEFQKRGAIHYHAIMFNLPFIENEKLAMIWGNGFIKINAIDQVTNIGVYVTKYMTKENYEEAKSDRLIGKKSYFTSRGLIKPQETIDKKEIEQSEAVLSPIKTYEANFENDYLGKINYKQYNPNIN